MAKKSSKDFDDPIPQLDFIKYLLDNSGRIIDNEFVCEVIEKFGAEVIINPALAYIMAR